MRKHSMYTRLTVLAILSGLWMPPCFAADNSITGHSLLMSNSARGSGMGDAFVAAANGASSIFYNPSGLSFSEFRELNFSYYMNVASIGMGDLGFVSPITRNKNGFGVSVQYVDYGVEKRTTLSDPTGSSGRTFSGSDYVVNGAYGHRLSENIGLGFNLKYYNTTLDNSSASSFALDLGARSEFGLGSLPMSAGLTVKNIGTAIKHDRVTEYLPTSIRAGVATQVGKFLLTGDVEKITGDELAFHTGVEYNVVRFLAIRAGYNGRIDAGSGLTAGASFNTKNFWVDYAFVPFGELGTTHRVGMTLAF